MMLQQKTYLPHWDMTPEDATFVWGEDFKIVKEE